jgi:hypothetical protein
VTSNAAPRDTEPRVARRLVDRAFPTAIRERKRRPEQTEDQNRSADEVKGETDRRQHAAIMPFCGWGELRVRRVTKGVPTAAGGRPPTEPAVREKPPFPGLSRWAVPGSNQRPPACKEGAHPAELAAPPQDQTNGPDNGREREGYVSLVSLSSGSPGASSRTSSCGGTGTPAAPAASGSTRSTCSSAGIAIRRS